jgi:hypothetical protein
MGSAEVYYTMSYLLLLAVIVTAYLAKQESTTLSSEVHEIIPKNLFPSTKSYQEEKQHPKRKAARSNKRASSDSIPCTRHELRTSVKHARVLDRLSNRPEPEAR